jgi:hypothetical protein
MRTSSFICRRSLRTAAFLCCFSLAQILTAAEPVPSNAASPVPASKTADSTMTEDQPGSGKFDSSNRKSKLPQKPETFESLFQSSPSQPLRLPPPQLQVPNKQTRKMLDDRENWIFVTPEDVLQDYMVSQKLTPPKYGPDGREESSLSAVERYYDRQSRARRAAKATAAKSSDGSPKDSDFISDFSDFDDVSSPSRDSSQPGRNTIFSHPNSLADLFGMSKGGISKADALREAQEERHMQELQLESFRKLMDLPQMSDPTAGFNRPGIGEGYPGSSQPTPYATPTPGYTPLPTPAFPAIPSAPTAPFAPGQAPPPTLPPSVTATRAAPPKMDFSVPMRKF